MINNSNILIIGGSGFIGSHLCEVLASKNKVISLDNYLTGSKKNHVPMVEYITGDCMNIFDILGDYEPQYIYHFGEYSRVETSFDDYDLVIENNLFSMKNVLKYSSLKKAKLIYAGSSTKFGDDHGGARASPYAWSKSVNTEHLKNFAEWFSLNYAIVYFYNAYGGREIRYGKYATLIGIFKEIYMNGNKDFPVVKPGTQLRNFTHYSDIVSGLIAVGEKGYGDGYGIGSDESYSILDVVDILDGSPKFLSKRKGNRLSAELKTQKTKDLGWMPKKNLEKYLINFKKTQ